MSSELEDLDGMVPEVFARSRINTVWRHGSKPAPRTAVIAREALRLRQQGTTFREIGRRLGCSGTHAARLVTKARQQESRP